MKPESNEQNSSKQMIENGEIRRAIRRPYYLFRTPDGLGSYLQKENYRIVMARRESLCKFLAPTSIDAGERDTRGKASQVLVYDMSKFQDQNLEPADAIPRSAIEAFEAAANEFYSKEGISAHEKNLRLNFKLPDPDLEPNCYWLYGPPENRNLLILWGCEARENTSIPMIECSGIKDEGVATVAQKLRKRIMDWASMRKETIKLLNASENPLARFIATPVFTKKGVLKELETVSGKLSASKAKKMRHIGKSEIQTFEEAAGSFYEEAYPESGAISEYEKELRSHFKLADPSLKPSSFYKHGGKLYILANPDDEEEECLYLVEDDTLNIPPLVRDDKERVIDTATLLDRLKTKKTPRNLYAALSAVAVVMLAGLGFVVARNIDGEGPHMINASAENFAEKVTAFFDEPIQPDSFLPANEAFIIKEVKTGKSLEVHSAQIDPESGSAVILETDEMVEGCEYELAVYKMSDNSFRKNPIEAGSDNARTTFVFQDTWAPNPPSLSAEGTDSRKLLLIFDEALELTSAQNKRNYSIEGFNILNAELLDDQKTVVLTAENQSRDIKQKGFADKGRYNLTISDVTDNSSNKNPIVDPNAVDEKDARIVHIDNFQYIDTVAPVLDEINSPDQIVTRLTFREPIAPATAIPDNISLSDQDGENIKVIMANIPQTTPDVIEIHHAPFYPGKEYNLQVINIGDIAGNTIEFLTEPQTFRYTGPVDSDLPEIIEAKTFGEYKNITITFDEPVIPDTVKTASFSLLINGNPAELKIDSVDLLDKDGRKYVINLKTPLTQSKSFNLVYSGVKDKVGNEVEKGQSPRFLTGMLILDSILEPTGKNLISTTRVELSFNTNLLKETATNLLNYRFTDSKIKVYDVEFDETKPNKVIIEFEKPTDLSSQILTVSNMKIEDLPESIQYAVKFRF